MTRPSAGAAKHAPRAKRTPFVLLLGGLVVGGLCALLALNTASAANEVQRHDLALRDQNIAAQVVQLQNDQQASAAPANLARAAEALGMVPAGNPGFLEIGSRGHVRLVGHAAPATAAPLPVPTPAPTPTHHPAQHKNKQDKNKQDKNKPAKKNKNKDKTKRGTSQPNKNKNKTGTTKTDKKTGTAKSDPKPGNNTGGQTGGQTGGRNAGKKSTNKTKHDPKHHAQSHHERRAGAPITTITIPGGPR